MKRKFEDTVTKEAVPVALICGLLLLVCAGAWRFGRIFPAEKEEYRVAGPVEAFFVMKASGTRGRVGIFFTPDLYMEKILYQSFLLRDRLIAHQRPDLTKDNYLCMLLYDNIVRKAYIVVPSADWPRISLRLSMFPFVSCKEGQCRFTVEGAPVIFTTVTGVPSFGESVLVYINGAFAGEYGGDVPARYLAADKRVTDMVVIEDVRLDK